MIEAYGGSCTCCGEKIKEFLTLEHLEKDGQAHEKRLGSSWMIWRELKKLDWPKEKYTVLCMNCNWGKRYRSQCPHQL